MRWWCSGHCSITISRGPGFDPRARQEKEVPMNTLVCTCGSFVELLSAFRSLSGDNLALASHCRMGQSHKKQEMNLAALFSRWHVHIFNVYIYYLVSSQPDNTIFYLRATLCRGVYLYALSRVGGKICGYIRQIWSVKFSGENLVKFSFKIWSVIYFLIPNARIAFQI